MLSIREFIRRLRISSPDPAERFSHRLRVGLAVFAVIFFVTMLG